MNGGEKEAKKNKAWNLHGIAIHPNEKNSNIPQGLNSLKGQFAVEA